MSDDKEPVSIENGLHFNSAKQQAIVGWAVVDEGFFHECRRVVQSTWFTSRALGRIFEVEVAYWNKYHKKPSALEIKTDPAFSMGTERERQNAEDALVEAVKKTKVFGLDALRGEMTNWMHTVILHQTLEAAAARYTARKVEDAWKLLDESLLKKTTCSFEDGIAQGFKSSSERIEVEARARAVEAPYVLPYGNDFLDASLGGIGPKDLILVSARTGQGKTELATSISQAVGSIGHPVYYFALEAEEGEIERRIKYNIISNEYYRRTAGDPARAHIRYLDWRRNRLEHLLKPIEEETAVTWRKRVANIHTLYRIQGSFDAKALEKHLLDVVGKARLVVLDHLSYVDVDDKDTDENRGYQKVLMRVREMGLHYSVPVVVVVHLRKHVGGTKTRGLLPSLDDIMGTSNVPKIATTGIMVGHASEGTNTHRGHFGTYLGVSKCRLDGTLSKHVGLITFDARCNQYLSGFQVGQDSGGEWEALKGKNIPYWARVPGGEYGEDDYRAPGMG